MKRVLLGLWNAKPYLISAVFSKNNYLIFKYLAGLVIWRFNYNFSEFNKAIAKEYFFNIKNLLNY